MEMTRHGYLGSAENTNGVLAMNAFTWPKDGCHLTKKRSKDITQNCIRSADYFAGHAGNGCTFLGPGHGSSIRVENSI